MSYYKSGVQTTIYGVDDILEYQVGYGVDENGNPLDGWNPNHLVICDCDSDPYCIDLSEESGAVYFSYHGMGYWRFDKVYDTLADFLSNVSKR